MIHLPELIQDLGFILIAAAIVSLLCKRFKQPVVLGYLIAGFLVGPHVTFVPTVKDTESIKVWAEIGVIFLLFGLGLEFSFKKLAQVGKSASITALFEILFMLFVGYLVGKSLGWSYMDSLFLGGILSISSTTIIVRAFDELGLKTKSFARLVFGVLIVEDLIAILLLVLLSSMAITQSLSGADLAQSSVRLLFFMALWFILGIYILPVFLRKVHAYLSDETTLIISIGLCLMMVMVASAAGFSPALGAFVMGSLLAETREGHRIEHLLLPVKDLFAAIFFVSVGMMIDPQILSNHFGLIVLLSTITIFGKLLSSGLGALISGKSLKTSIQAGMSLAQIGEFSFIIATLGLSLKVTSDFLYPVAVAVSAVTTFTTPYLIKYSDSFYTWLEPRLTEQLKSRLRQYEVSMNTTHHDKVLGLIWREYGLKICLNAVVVVAIGLCTQKFLVPALDRNGLNSSWLNTLVCILNLILASPFLWAIAIAAPPHKQAHKPEVLAQLRGLQMGLSIARLILAVVLSVWTIDQYASIPALIALAILIISISGFYFSRLSEALYNSVEKRFLQNLSDKERDELSKNTRTSELAPWDSNLTQFTVSPHSPLIATAFERLGLKEKYGITIALIQRAEERIVAPGRNEILLPGDQVFALGSDEQLLLFKNDIEKKLNYPGTDTSDHFGLSSLLIPANSNYVSKSIRECGLRESVQGLIVGIERNGERILNPDSSIILQANDLLWIVGHLKKIAEIRKA